MTTALFDKSIAAWARVGVLFGGRAAAKSPDLERLLLDTARVTPYSARLFNVAVTWLSVYGGFVARHRLKHLVETELEVEAQPVLGLLIELAVKHGASRELAIALAACAPAAAPRPLFESQRGNTAIEAVARRRACAESRRWRLWAPDVQIKLDAIRPAPWILRHNPGYIERVVRKGDLRCSILETLRRDAPGGEVESEVALAALCSANRIAVRHVLDDLANEGYALRRAIPGARNIQVVVCPPVVPLPAA